MKKVSSNLYLKSEICSYLKSLMHSATLSALVYECVFSLFRCLSKKLNSSQLQFLETILLPRYLLQAQLLGNVV